MSISSVSSDNSLGQIRGCHFIQRRTDFQRLVSALDSEDLSTAQQAFGKLQSDWTRAARVVASITSKSSNDNPIQQLMGQIGSALQSGNVGSAKQFFTNFKQQTASSTRSEDHHRGGETRSTVTTL